MFSVIVSWLALSAASSRACSSSDGGGSICPSKASTFAVNSAAPGRRSERESGVGERASQRPKTKWEHGTAYERRATHLTSNNVLGSKELRLVQGIDVLLLLPELPDGRRFVLQPQQVHQVGDRACRFLNLIRRSLPAQRSAWGCSVRVGIFNQRVGLHLPASNGVPHDNFKIWRRPI